MVSWLVYALVLGGFAGLLVFALMDMAQKEDQRAARAERTIKLQLLGTREIDPHWGTVHSHEANGKLALQSKRGARVAA